MFELVVEAFEDRGAHWRLPVEAVDGFQFERGAERLAAPRENELRGLAERFDQALELPAENAAREQTARALAAERARVRAELESRPALGQLDIARCSERREGSAEAAAGLQALLDDAGLADLDTSFAATYVSNPSSGESVKGHAIVLAEMGLCPYAGRIVRDPRIFAGDGAKERRRAHILLRLAFLAELMALLGISGVELFRGIAADGPVTPARGRSFVAATFSSAVALAHLERCRGGRRPRAPARASIAPFHDLPRDARDEPALPRGGGGADRRPRERALLVGRPRASRRRRNAPNGNAARHPLGFFAPRRRGVSALRTKGVPT